MFSEFSDFFFVASSEEFDFFDGGFETSFEVGSDEGGVVAVFSEGGDFLFEFFAESVFVVVSGEKKRERQVQ